MCHLKTLGIQISQRYWTTDRPNYCLTHFRQINKTINTDIKPN